MKDLYSYMYEAKTSPKLKSGRYNAGNARINVETGMVTITAPGYVSLETYTFPSSQEASVLTANLISSFSD